MNVFPISRKSNVVVQSTKQETLIYDLTNNKVFCLNESSTLVWQLCDGNKSITEITNLINIKLKLKVNEEFILLALEQLKKENLIENELPDYFKGLSRREVIRKIGFGTLAALPFISTIVAPLPANASSSSCTTCIKKGDTCTPECLNELGTCYDNAGCGGGQFINNVTCADCKSGAVVFAGGAGTGSWVGN